MEKKHKEGLCKVLGRAVIFSAFCADFFGDYHHLNRCSLRNTKFTYSRLTVIKCWTTYPFGIPRLHNGTSNPANARSIPRFSGLSDETLKVDSLSFEGIIFLLILFSEFSESTFLYRNEQVSVKSIELKVLDKPFWEGFPNSAAHTS